MGFLQKSMDFVRMNISRRGYFLTRLYKNYIRCEMIPTSVSYLMENFSLVNSHNLLENPLLFPTEITNLLFVVKLSAAEIKFYAELQENYGKEKRMVISIAFCDFALWNSDHRNLGLVFPKFLFFWAEWNAQRNGTKSNL